MERAAFKGGLAWKKPTAMLKAGDGGRDEHVSESGKQALGAEGLSPRSYSHKELSPPHTHLPYALAP